jgi:tight adherence protein B
MDLLALAAVACVMGAVVLGFIGFFQTTANPRKDLDRRLGSVLASGGGSYEVTVEEFTGRTQQRLGRVPFISTFLQDQPWTTNLAEDLEKADIKLTASEYVAIRALVALLAVLAVTMVLGTGILALILMAVGAFVGFKLPALWVRRAQDRRTAKLNDQLIEMLSMTSNSLKAGFGLMQSFDLASRQLEHPIATELRRLMYDVNIGTTTEAALQAMSKRSNSQDFDIVITAILVQQATGGNLAEILDNVAHTMRERVRIRGEIKTLTSQQRLTGFIIGGLPFAMAALFSVISPGYMQPLFTTPIGWAMLAAGGVLELIGVLLIKKILSIEV